jgi:hypothetical protein
LSDALLQAGAALQRHGFRSAEDFIEYNFPFGSDGDDEFPVCRVQSRFARVEAFNVSIDRRGRSTTKLIDRTF